MIDLNDVLLAMSNIPVDDPIAEIWGRGLQGGYKIIEYTGSLPITINANGDALIDYRIYGASGGVGEVTENLIDASKSDVDQRVELEPNTDYCLCKYTGSGQGEARCYVYDENDNQLFGDYINVWVSYSFTNPSNGAYAIISFRNLVKGKVSFAKGFADNNFSLYPANYIPYGYKLPMTVSDQNLLADNISQFGDGCITAWGSISSPDETKKEKYSDYVSIVPNTNYIFAMANVFPGNPSGNEDEKPWRTIAFYDQNKAFINRLPISVDAAKKTNPVTVTSPTDAFFARVTWRSYGSEECPVLVTNRNVCPVYIGENQLDSVEGVSDYVDKSSDKIVRMIGEYTFTGDESFNKYGNSDVFYTSTTIDPVGITTVNTITMRCNHPAFTAIENKDTRYWLNPEADDICCFLPGGMSQVFLRSTPNFTTATECKAYLKAQYDNGTPVKISYWLKTPIEGYPPVPLPEIPTIDGETVIDYDGTPKPSQMYVKYKVEG